MRRSPFPMTGQIALERGGRPFGIEAIREIQLSKLDALDVLAEARKNFTTKSGRCSCSVQLG